MYSTPSDRERVCPICGAASRYVFTSVHDRRIFGCANSECGHFFTPLLAEAHGQQAATDEPQRLSEGSLRRYGERNRRLLRLVLREMGRSRERLAFLDVGAGDAHVARTFKQVLGDRAAIYCFDPAPAFRGFYGSHGLTEVSSLTSIPEPIDVAYLIEVVEHLEDPVATLEAVKKALSPAGILFLSTPEGSTHPSETHAYEAKGHLHFFTPRSLNLALSAAGFEPIAFRHFPEIDPPPQGMLARARQVAKALARPWVLPILRPHVSYGHLAGVTRPVPAASDACAPTRP